MVHACNPSKILLQKQTKKSLSNEAKSCLNPQWLSKHIKVWYILSVGLWCLCLINKRLLGLVVYISYIIGSVKAYLCWLVGYCFRIFLLLFFSGFVCWECLKKAQMTITQAITHLTYCSVPWRGMYNLNVFPDTPLGEVLYSSIMFKFQVLRTIKNFPAPVSWHLQSPLLLWKNGIWFLSRKAQMIGGWDCGYKQLSEVL